MSARRSPAAVRGRTLVLGEGLSLWGGMDPASGELIDSHHPQRGASLAGRVVIMPSGRGSSSSASVLAEAARAGTAPAAFVLGEPDLILSVGAAVAEELYGTRIPVIVRSAARLARIPDGVEMIVGPRGGLRRVPTRVMSA